MLLRLANLLVVVTSLLLIANVAAAAKPNILIITTDDMSADSVGAFGCKLPDTTPHMDALAKSGLRFRHAHVQVGNCMPSRNVMWSGRYPHNNRVEGFYQVPSPGYPVLCDLMKSAGYFTGIRGKVSHSTPFYPYAWDAVLDSVPGHADLHPKDPKSYGVSTTHGIRSAVTANKPFCLIINVADPHKPFYAEDNRTGGTIPDPHQPSRVFTPAEVPIPGFLFDDPVVRKELSHYYSSVRRADDSVGEVLAALKASGHDDDTLVMFLSDHGMPLPFAKTQLYHHSTHTPLIVRWPGVTKPDATDDHLVSAVDFLPTLLDAAGIAHPAGLDGRSFAPLLKGERQSGREMVVKEYNENSGGSRDPMRAIQTKRFLYLYNPWSNGERIMKTATTGTPTYRRFQELAASDLKLAERHKLYQFRVVEELFDVENDPDCLKNLIADPTYATERDRLRGDLEAWMVKSADPMLEVFRRRDDAQFREAYVAGQEREADTRRATSGKGKAKAKGKGKGAAKRVAKGES